MALDSRCYIWSSEDVAHIGISSLHRILRADSQHVLCLLCCTGLTLRGPPPWKLLAASL